MNMKKDRYLWVDCAKGIGIILVVYGHVVRGLINADIVSSNKILSYVDSIIYTFHMPLFFFLSGLFFSKTLYNNGECRTLLSKIDTVIYPFIVWSLIQGFIEVFLSSYTNGHVTVVEVLSLVWSPRAHFWFLYVLFASMLCFVLFQHFFGRFGRFGRVCCFISSFIIYILSSNMESMGIVKDFSESFIFFVIGCFFFQLRAHEIIFSKLYLVTAFLVFISMQLVFHLVFDFNFNDKNLFSLILSVLSFLFVSSLSYNLTSFFSKFIAYIGSMSLYIYLLHILAGSGVRIALKSVFHVNSFSVHLFFGILLSLVLPVIFYMFTQKFGLGWFFSAPISRLFKISSVER